MANDPSTLLARKAVRLGQLSDVILPPYEPLPDSFLKRFPELVEYNDRKRREFQSLSDTIRQLIASKQT